MPPALVERVLSEVLVERGLTNGTLSHLHATAIAGEVTRRLLTERKQSVDLKSTIQRLASDAVRTATRNALRYQGTVEGTTEQRTLQFQLSSKLMDHLCIGVPETARVLSNMWMPDEPLRMDGRLFRFVGCYSVKSRDTLS